MPSRVLPEEVIGAIGKADAGDALVPVTAEAEGGGSVRDEREADLAIERGVALLVEGLESRKALPKELLEKTRLLWTVLRLDGPQDGGLGCGIHIEKDVRKRRDASGEEKRELD